MSRLAQAVTHRGGCHCGAVRFEVDAPAHAEVLECNCSMCAKLGYLHLIVARAAFRLTRGEARLASYRARRAPKGPAYTHLNQPQIQHYI